MAGIWRDSGRQMLNFLFMLLSAASEPLFSEIFLWIALHTGIKMIVTLDYLGILRTFKSCRSPRFLIHNLK